MLWNLGRRTFQGVRTSVLIAFACLATVVVLEQPLAAQGPVGYGPQGAQGYGQIQPTAATSKSSKPRRALPSVIDSTPDSTETLEIIHHRSQLMVTRSQISRIAIANPEIIDVVQYSPTEISIIGLQLGTTTLHMWFDKQRDPLIYLVEIIRDPSFDERMKADFGKLEKQLQILFPNSKVYLIPLQQRLIVKGQAKDEEDAAHILQIVRSAYFAEFGPNGYGGYGNGYGGGGGFGNGYGNGNGDNDNDDNDDGDDFIVNMLEVPGNHLVMLHVKVAELQRNDLRRMGVDLRAVIGDYAFATGSLASAVATGTAVGAAGAAGGAAATALGGGATGGALQSGSVTGVLSKGANSLFFNWLAANHTGKILASPTVTVLSGHEASFQSGGEFPVQTTIGVGGNQTAATAYRSYGTSITVRPQVIDRDWVKLDISSEYSDIDQTLSSAAGQGLSVRSVTTSVKLREGQTIVLAGLFGHTGSTNVARIPFFGELPLIGSVLFNGKVASKGENELLITVTPELVRAMEPDEVPPYPGFYVTWPNDIELYQYAKTEGYPDQGVYQLSPYGWGPGHGSEIGYRPFNPASFSTPFGSGGGSLGSGMGMNTAPGMMMAPPLSGGGYMANPQPSQLYPAPPVPVAPQGAAPNAPLQPTADPNMGMRAGGGVQQVGYEQPASRSSGLWRPFGRGNSDANNRNPALSPNNSTAPSLQNGNDGRIGPNGQRPVAPQRGRY